MANPNWPRVTPFIAADTPTEYPTSPRPHKPHPPLTPIPHQTCDIQVTRQ
jgi:hypothetical protein